MSYYYGISSIVSTLGIVFALYLYLKAAHLLRQSKQYRDPMFIRIMHPELLAWYRKETKVLGLNLAWVTEEDVLVAYLAHLRQNDVPEMAYPDRG